MEKIRKLGLVSMILYLTMAVLPAKSQTIASIQKEAETQSIYTIPYIQDPTPGYWETSEYMIAPNGIAVSVILPESNGSIDTSTEDWTDEEIEKVLSEIQIALDWWTSQNPNASVSLVTEVHDRVPTSYEPINRKGSERNLWISEVMNYLGYSSLGRHYTLQERDFVNHLRERLGTDWAFAIFIVDSSNDTDGAFADGHAEFAEFGGTSLFMTYDNGKLGIENMDLVSAHEMGHIFWADDEYFHTLAYKGYLNASRIPRSGCIMDSFERATWSLSGAPHGHNGTWGQVGWRDSDGDGVQDIVDTFPRVYIDSYETIENKLNFIGVAAVTPFENKNPWTNNPDGRRDVTVNIIQNVEFRIDNGTWLNATIKPTEVRKLMRYPDYYETKLTNAIVNYTITTPPLEAGNHMIQIRATNSVNNTVSISETFEISGLIGDINGDEVVDIFDVVLAAIAFGSEPGDDNWNQAADLNNDDIVDIFDIVILANNFGS